MKKKFFYFLFAFLLGTLVVTKNNKIKVINFETDITVGKRVGVDSTYLEARRKSKFKKLFFVRKNFSKKINESVNNL